MAICETCGSKNAKGFKYCSECGSQSPAESVIAEEKGPAPKPNLLENKFVVFGGGGILATVLIALLVVVLTPFSLDTKTAESRLMKSSDFAFDAAFADEPLSAEDSVYPIYRASERCVEDVDMQALINDKGTLLATADFKENSAKNTSVYFDEDVIRFEDEATANEFLALAKAGYDNPECEYNSSGDSVSTVGVLSGASDVQSKLGVGGSNSFYLRYQSEMKVSGYFNFTISTDRRIAVIARGQYVGVFRGTIDVESKSVSPDEMEQSLKTAISKMFG